MSSYHGSPSKGKGKEEDYWSPGWWELQPLIEHEERPVAWSVSSTIFTAHATEPLIFGRLFPTAKEFVVPSPPPIVTSATLFEPPTTINVCPSDKWLFAYFPGRNGDGLGCFWFRGLEVDNWHVKEWLTFPRGSGVVSSAWLGNARKWVTDAAGRAIRLPSLGPHTPCSSPTLMVITRALQANIYYIRHGTSSFKVLNCSLTQPDQSQESQLAPQPFEMPSGSGGVKTCVSAAIGLAYNESSILIATQSRTVPPPISTSSFSIDTSLPIDISQPDQVSDSLGADDWDDWGQEPAINLCEVRIGFDCETMSLSTNPLPSLYCQSQRLSKLAFIPRNPNSNAADARTSIYLAASFLDFGAYTSTPKSELQLYSLSRNPSPSNNSRSAWLARKETSRVFSSEILTFVSPHTTGLPSDTVLVGTIHSSMNVPKIKRKSKETVIGNISVLQLPSLNNDNRWRSVPISSSGADSVFPDSLSPNGVLLCTLSPPLRFPAKISIEPVPRLYSDEILGPSAIGRGHAPIPQDAYVLVSAMHARGSLSDIVHHLSLASTPLGHAEDVLRGTLTLLEQRDDSLHRHWLSSYLGLVLEVYRSRAGRTDDLTLRDELDARHRTAQNLCSVIACHNAFEDCRDGELYDLEAVWPLIGLSSWFLELVEGLLKECVLSSNAYADASAIPPLPQSRSPAGKHTDKDPFNPTNSPPSRKRPPPTAPTAAGPTAPPILLHLVHPHALAGLRAVLADVRRLCDQLVGTKGGTERVRMARNVLLDGVQASGIQLKELEGTLTSAAEELSGLDGEPNQHAFFSPCSRFISNSFSPPPSSPNPLVPISRLIDTNLFETGEQLRSSLATCRPRPALAPALRVLVHKLAGSGAIDKPRLFIKPDDVFGGAAGAQFFDGDENNDNVQGTDYGAAGRDVVSKGTIAPLRREDTRVCLRCGGKSERLERAMADMKQTSLKWRAWERKWGVRCICGGLWVGTMQNRFRNLL
ncbi:hypothetical protein EW146_g628 [Bondarzewia mesenterica]|uniref:Mediator complex subunit 16 C-terminal domain-containing protein n=1 Tax=Bondarzewia mesenterica TaxID=1095465 RepID=A0A4S4M6B5_9AGAM|nr:hypothetical protein EW146_g628 [Bondarzewia mesenterica]